MHTRITPRPESGPTIQAANRIGGSNRPRLLAPLGTAWTDEDLEPFLIDDYQMDQQPLETQILLDLAAALTLARIQWVGAASRSPANHGGRRYREAEGYREPKTSHKPTYNPRSSRR